MEMDRTIEPRLQSSMLASTAFTVVLIHNERPWLTARFEALCDTRNGVSLGLSWLMVVVECDVNIATFVVHSLKRNQQGHDELAVGTNSDY